MNLIGNAGVGRALGKTAHGRDFVIKALHPASEITLTKGVPTMLPQPTVLQRMDLTFVVQPPAGCATAWTANAMLYANPWCLGCVVTNDGATTEYNSFFNSILGSTATFGSAIREYLYNNVEQYRLVHASATAILDATATTDSGMIASAQYILEPVPMTNDTSSGVVSRCWRKTDFWSDTPKSYSVLSMMPSAYTGSARDGVYVPLKLDPDFPFVRTNDVTCLVNNVDAAPMPYDDPTSDWPAAGTSGVGLPFGTPSCDRTPSYVICPRNCSRFVSQTYFSNLNPAASLRFTLHYTFEFIVPPSVVYASFIRAPSDPDPQALMAYVYIAQRLKDAYPAEYNHVGKILESIWSVVKGGLSALVPELAPALQLADVAGRAVVGGIRVLRDNARASSAKKSQQAQIDKAKAVLNQVSSQTALASSSKSQPARRRLAIQRVR